MASNQAKNNKLQQQLKDLTKCCICTKTFKDPRILPCLHTFCMICLEDVGSKSNKKSGQNMPCPLCDREFAIPSEGFNEIQKNFFLARYTEIEVSASHSSSRPIPLCGACLEDGNNPVSATQTPSAEMFCAVCCITMCENCLKIHRKSKVTASHKLEAVENQPMPGKNQFKLIPEFCSEHESELLKIYCSDCKKVVCSFCYIESHQRHKWLDVIEASDQFCSKIDLQVQSIALKNKRLQEKNEKLKQAKLNIVSGLESLKLEINQKTTFLIETIEKHANLLLMEVEALRQEKIKLCETEEEDIDLQIANEEYYALYCQEITAKGSAGDVCRYEDQLSERATDLQEMNDSICQRHLQPFRAVLTGSKLDEFLKDNGKNIIGKIEGTDSIAVAEHKQGTARLNTCIIEKGKQSQADDQIGVGAVSTTKEVEEASSRDVRTSETRKQPLREVFTQEELIVGMAIIESELFVATKLRADIEVYDSITLVFKRSWTLDGLCRPEDMVACSQLKCLFIFDATDQGKIYQVDRKGSILSTWFSGNKSVRLSVTPDSNVIVVFLNDNKLKEYAPIRENRLIQQLLLSSHFRYAIKLPSGNFLVSRGGKGAGVFEINTFGQELNSFKGNIGSAFTQLNWPEQLAIDNHGSVIVLNRGNGRVLLLNSKLVFQRQLVLSEIGLYDPLAMVLDKSTNRLFVAVWDIDKNIFKIFVGSY